MSERKYWIAVISLAVSIFLGMAVNAFFAYKSNVGNQTLLANLTRVIASKTQNEERVLQTLELILEKLSDAK